VRDLREVFTALETSAFRRNFSLGSREREYLRRKGMTVIVEHARDFVGRRLAPALPASDGRQTPFKGHPVFVAQHATATCCRSCLEKWHRIPQGRELTPVEQNHVVSAIAMWLENEESSAN
jgi:hypothetical protein